MITFNSFIALFCVCTLFVQPVTWNGHLSCFQSFPTAHNFAVTRLICPLGNFSWGAIRLAGPRRNKSKQRRGMAKKFCQESTKAPSNPGLHPSTSEPIWETNFIGLWTLTFCTKLAPTFQSHHLEACWTYRQIVKGERCLQNRNIIQRTCFSLRATHNNISDPSQKKKICISLGLLPFLQGLLCCVLDLWWDPSLWFQIWGLNRLSGYGGHWQPYHLPSTLISLPSTTQPSLLETLSLYLLQVGASIKQKLVLCAGLVPDHHSWLSLLASRHAHKALHKQVWVSSCWPLPAVALLSRPGPNSPCHSWICWVISPHVTSVSQKPDRKSTQLQQECHWNQPDEGTRGNSVIQCLVV